MQNKFVIYIIAGFLAPTSGQVLAKKDLHASTEGLRFGRIADVHVGTLARGHVQPSTPCKAP